MYASSSVSAWYVTSQPVTRLSSSATSCSVIALGTGLVVRAPVVTVAEQDRDGSVRYVVACHRPDVPVGPCQGGEHVHVVAQECIAQAGGVYVPLGVPVITGERECSLRRGADKGGVDDPLDASRYRSWVSPPETMKKVRTSARVLRIASGSSYEASAASAPRRSGVRLSTRTTSRWPWPDSTRRAATLPLTASVIPSTMSSAVMCQVYLVSSPRSPTFGETVCFSEARRSYEPSWGRDGLNNETSCFPSRIPRHRVHESTNYDFPDIS